MLDLKSRAKSVTITLLVEISNLDLNSAGFEIQS